MTAVRRAKNYIEANFHKPVTVRRIARACGLSTSRLSHVFREKTGLTVIEYVTMVRIGKAKDLLLGTDTSCTEICFQVGYGNQSYFIRTFKRIVGTTPGRFRLERHAPEGRSRRRC
jgi:two-component system response regulator YesN